MGGCCIPQHQDYQKTNGLTWAALIFSHEIDPFANLREQFDPLICSLTNLPSLLAHSSLATENIFTPQ